MSSGISVIWMMTLKQVYLNVLLIVLHFNLLDRCATHRSAWHSITADFDLPIVLMTLAARIGVPVSLLKSTCVTDVA